MTPDAARRALASLFDELDASEPTEAMRWAVYGYVYGLRHAGVLAREDFNAYLDRLGITGDEASRADVAL